MARTFAKKTTGTNKPPAGTVKFVVGNQPVYTIDDTTHLTYVAPTEAEADLLRNFVHQNGWLTES